MTTADTTPAQAEASVEKARAGLVDTLNQLRENLKPGNMADEVMSNARVTASAVTDQVWDVARKNPIPALLIGAGAAMILGIGTKAATSTGKAPARDAGPDLRPSAGSRRAATRPSSGALGSEQQRHIAMAGTNDVLDRANDQMRGLAGRGTRAVGQLRNTLKSESPMSNYSRTRDQISGSLSRLIEEQPLILAAFGLAVGAALGAAIPQTDAENSLLGEHAHTLRDSAQDLVQGQVEHLKAAASHAVEDIKASAADRGLSTDNLGGLVRDVAEHTKNATYEAGRGLDPTT